MKSGLLHLKRRLVVPRSPVLVEPHLTDAHRARVPEQLVERVELGPIGGGPLVGVPADGEEDPWMRLRDLAAAVTVLDVQPRADDLHHPRAHRLLQRSLDPGRSVALGEDLEVAVAVDEGCRLPPDGARLTHLLLRRPHGPIAGRGSPPPRPDPPRAAPATIRVPR